MPPLVVSATPNTRSETRAALPPVTTERARARRNVTVDVLRGCCIVMMVASHTGTDTWTNTLVHPFRFVSGAEGFVFLSGLVLGMVYRRRLDAAPARQSYAVLWRRAGMLWLVHCVTVLAALAANAAWLGYGDLPHPGHLGWVRTAAMVAGLQLQPGRALNVLPLYVILIALTPALLEALRRGRTPWVLGASLGLLGLHQAYPALGRVPSPVVGGDAFPLLGWQALFVGGLAVGYHSALLRATVLARHRRTLAWALPALCLVVMAVVWAQTPTFGLYDHERWDAVLWERSPLRLGRVAYFVLAISAAYLAVQALGRRAALLRAPLDALAVLGRNSLYSFLVHLAAALGLGMLRMPVGVAAELVPIGAVGFVYAMARFQVGRRFIPN